MKASLKNYRQSPRKVRLIADLVRGKKLDQAIKMLGFVPKRASRVFKKMLDSARANAVNTGKAAAADLVIKKITVDQGVTLKRYRPVSKGAAHRINKRTSNINIELADSSVK